MCVYVCVHNVHRRQSIQNAIWQWRLTLSALHPRVSNQNRQIKRSRSLHKPNITISKHTHTHTREADALREHTNCSLCMSIKLFLPSALHLIIIFFPRRLFFSLFLPHGATDRPPLLPPPTPVLLGPMRSMRRCSLMP